MGSAAQAMDLPINCIVCILTRKGMTAHDKARSACVAKKWAEAAKSPKTWSRIDVVPNNSGYNGRSFTGAVLRRLVNVAGDGLQVVSVTGAVKLVDDDLLCLRLPAAPALKCFAMHLVFKPAPCQEVWYWDTKVSAQGVATALEGRTDMRQLKVLGLSAYKASADLMDRLRALVGNRPERLDVTGICPDRRWYRDWICHRLIAHSVTARQGRNSERRPILGSGATVITCSECEAPACRFCIKRTRLFGAGEGGLQRQPFNLADEDNGGNMLRIGCDACSESCDPQYAGVENEDDEYHSD